MCYVVCLLASFCYVVCVMLACVRYVVCVMLACVRYVVCVMLAGLCFGATKTWGEGGVLEMGE